MSDIITHLTLSGSNVGAVLGLHPDKKPEDVMREMVRAYHNAEPEFKGNIATEHGKTMERVALQSFKLAKVRKLKDTRNLVANEEYIPLGNHENPWTGIKPSWLVGDDTLVEIKCPFGAFMQYQKGKPFTLKPIAEKPHYFAQVQWALMATGRRYCYFFQFVHAQAGGWSIEKVAIDNEWLNKHIPFAFEFYQNYLREREENYTHHLEPKLRVLRKREAILAMEEYHNTLEQIDRAEERKQELLNQILELAGHEPCEISGSRLVKTVKKGSISYAKIVNDKIEDLTEEEKDKYRGKGSVVWSIKAPKVKKE